MVKKEVLISVYELNPNTGLYVAAVATRDLDGKVVVSFYMGERVISAQFLYGICEDIDFSQSALDAFLTQWFREHSYNMYLEYYMSLDQLEL